ncbi:transmembrane protein 245-like [Paramacrobiotus metropolitanus]|uniref:transmembrane protein 245-like n=1 Tax=Paramacrobiotus metropolitanus TaxID=2943436 RepID=UPI002445EAC8|nr:transmembrane protein 245-like [Paramacrobiotus metropolitanus]
MPSQVLDIVAAMAYANRSPQERIRQERNMSRRISIIAGIPEKQFRVALLNGFGQFFIVVLVLAGYQVYILLESFLRPLAWAVITGIVLFPFKTAMSGWAKLWVDYLKETNTPLAVGIVGTPLKLADMGLDYLGDVVLEIFYKRKTDIGWAIILFSASTVFQVVLYVSEVDVITSLYTFSGFLVRVAASNWVWSVIIAYVVILTFLWEDRYKERICTVALPVHLAMAIHLAAQFGAMSLPVLVFGFAILGIGFIGELKSIVKSIRGGAHHEDIQMRIDSWGRFAVLSPWHFAWWPALVRAKRQIATAQIDFTEPLQTPEEEEDENRSRKGDEESEANRYIVTLLKMFFLVQLWKNVSMVPLLIFPTVYSYLKYKIPRSRAFNQIVFHVKNGISWVKAQLGDRKNAIIPTPIVGVCKMALHGDRKILHILSNSIDEAASNLIIVLMFVSLLVGGLIVVFQVQKETSYLVRMSGDFMNTTITEHPELLAWLPGGSQVQNQLQNSVDSLYIYSREFVGKQIKNAVSGDNVNTTESDVIVTEIMSVMDKIYYAYAASNVSAGNISAVTSDVIKGVRETKSSVFSWSFIQDYVMNHFDTLYSVLNSVTVIVTENAALIASMTTSIFSFILTYFSQFLDFILNGIFFLASLSFLLSLSGDQYYPLEKISRIAEYFPEAGNVSLVIESTINGIFNASFKLALFYGLYTYTLLSLFEIYVRFIPASIASIFAVIPLFPPYIVCVPAMIEILFVRKDYFLTVLLAVGAYIPTTFVDEVMYKEVKTAHPYLFGLSVAGGLMTMGIEGVIVGPIVLCAFVTSIELSRMILKPPSADDDVETRSAISNS